ncbi:MAG: hypothetical protein PHO02_02805 [Candidatus Nanoarchaeia archaeon]|nr:hypothetical protein [Candidatus Nanoarchaeia archaeon]
MAIDLNAFTDAYKTEDMGKLRALGTFDDLRVSTWEATLQRADKEKNPAEKYGMKSKLYGEISQVGSYFAGKEKLGASVASLGLDKEAELNLCVNVGKTLVDKLLE